MELQIKYKEVHRKASDPDGCASTQRHKDDLEVCLLAMQTAAAT